MLSEQAFTHIYHALSLCKMPFFIGRPDNPASCVGPGSNDPTEFNSTDFVLEFFYQTTLYCVQTKRERIEMYCVLLLGESELRLHKEVLKMLTLNPCRELASFLPSLGPIIHSQSFYYLADLHFSIENSVNFFGVNEILVDFMLLICKTAK